MQSGVPVATLDAAYVKATNQLSDKARVCFKLHVAATAAGDAAAVELPLLPSCLQVQPPPLQAGSQYCCCRMLLLSSCCCEWLLLHQRLLFDWVSPLLLPASCCHCCCRAAAHFCC